MWYVKFNVNNYININGLELFTSFTKSFEKTINKTDLKDFNFQNNSFASQRAVGFRYYLLFFFQCFNYTKPILF